MKRLLPLVVLLLIAATSVAQYGNEWVDHERRYWKFEVYANGTYRIDLTALANSGFPVSQVDPRHLMLFGKEQQVPIYVEGEADGEFNPGDFIEFRAEKADGTVDSRLYPYPLANPNPYYSLYNDTLRYYLTWDEQAPVQHIVPYSNSNINAHLPRPWVWTEAVRTYSDFYWIGYIDTGLGGQGITATNAMMIESEGFGGPPLFNNGSAVVDVQDASVLTPGAYTLADAPDARVTAVCAALNNDGGTNQMDHHLRFLYGPGFSNVALDSVFNGSRVVRKTFDMPASMVGPSVTVRYNVPHDLYTPLGLIGNPNYLDWQAPSSLGVRYARSLAIGNGDPLLASAPYDASDPLVRLDVSAFTGTPVIYAWGDTVRRITPTFNGASWPALFPQAPGTSGTQTYLFSQEGVVPITALRPVNGTGFFTDYGALNVDSAMLIVAHSSLMSGAQAYANYRQNESEVRYNVLLTDVDELYDQFGGGVPKHAGAIRMFCKFLLDTWSTDPRALFLIGKSVNTWPAFGINGLPSVRPNSGDAYANNLVPTYGYPSSDQCFTTGLNFDGRRMDIPVGRISAYTDDQVHGYLSKVRAMEQQPIALWQKNILHFAGGFQQGQQDQLSQLLNIYAAVAADTSFGGNPILFRRNSSDAIAQASADSVRYYIEDPDQGVTLMTFFAHAYAANFDITIDEPENYDWQGKHPMVIGNSCYIGDFHLNGPSSTSENWVLQPDVGPIAFMAATEQGIVPYLFNYTNEYYKSFCQLNYGGSIGEHMKHAGLQSQLNYPTLASMWNAQTCALQGDPTLTLNMHTKPDYTVDAAEVFFEPATVTADVDTFTVKVVVENQGRAVNRTFNVELKRTNPGLGPNAISYFETISNVYLRDTVEFRVPSQGFTGGAGLNQLQVRVDLEPDLVDEEDNEGNNVTTTTLFITSGDLVPVYPYDFAIVPDPVTELKASTGDPLAPPRTYLFQIDTTDLFNSPLLEATTIVAPGGVITWQPQSIYNLNGVQDSTVFYWRCSIDSTGNGGYSWYERSFQYIPNKRGWGQAHYFQFKNDLYSGLAYDRPQREWDFFTGLRNVRAEVIGNVAGPGTQWLYELQAQDYGGCGPPAWFVVVIDPVTLLPWETYGQDDAGVWQNEDHQFGNGNNGTLCRTRPEKVFHFAMNSPSELAGLQNMLDTNVPDGHHLLFYTWLYLDKDGMNASAPTLATQLQDLGVPDFSTLQDSVPYLFYVQKGDPASFQDTIGTAINDDVNFSVWISTAQEEGTINTLNAGAATSWDALYWDEKEAVGDSTRIRVKGLLQGVGTPQVLLDLPSAQDSVPDLATYINAQQYPLLQLEAYTKDTAGVDQQPVQLERWQLLNSPVPECAIHPPLAYYNALEGWGEGQEAAVAVAVQNISEFDMDNLLVGAWIVDASNNRRLVHYRVNSPLPAGAWLVDTVRFSTLGFGGWNTLVIEANPVDTTTGVYDQLEQYHFNNIAQWRFEVEEDLENPILDVTFDGMHILDGDIVSAKPEILISLDDENTIRLLSSPGDTAVFKIFLIRPGQENGERVWFHDGAGNEVLQFIPAGGTDNIAQIHYRPTFLADGTYRMIVQASDLSSNVSGSNDYKVNFEVINRSTITEVLNYPNPFTTSTRFVFTVTGTEPPTYMKIQIMTVTGKVIREIKGHELGPIRVGRNITEYAWDGTDEFGDRLARGVYLYRVIAQMNGEDIEMRETSASQYFTKGFGKMYLLR
ncbi:MAG: hypothetical protein IPG92_03070 [Flavobacteriales bacterium]|nr:hypothetical protein [Flavobacteriales bacterium]